MTVNMKSATSRNGSIRFRCGTIHYLLTIDALFGELNIFATMIPVKKAMTLITNGVPLSGIPG